MDDRITRIPTKTGMHIIFSARWRAREGVNPSREIEYTERRNDLFARRDVEAEIAAKGTALSGMSNLPSRVYTDFPKAERIRKRLAQK